MKMDTTVLPLLPICDWMIIVIEYQYECILNFDTLKLVFKYRLFDKLIVENTNLRYTSLLTFTLGILSST